MKFLLVPSLSFLFLASACATTNAEPKPQRYFGDKQSHRSSSANQDEIASAPQNGDDSAPSNNAAPPPAPKRDSSEKVASYQSVQTVRPEPVATTAAAPQPATYSQPQAASAPNPAPAAAPADSQVAYQSLKAMPSKDGQPASQPQPAPAQPTQFVAATAPAPQAAQANTNPSNPAAIAAVAPANNQPAPQPVQMAAQPSQAPQQAAIPPPAQYQAQAQPQAPAPAPAQAQPANNVAAAETATQPQMIQDTINTEHAAAPQAAPAPAQANAQMKDLFDRWERVWNQGQYDLIAGCVGPNYTRHDEYGNKTVTGAEYAKEIPAARDSRPHIQFEMYEHSFDHDRAWFRFTLKWNDKQSGAAKSQAGIQEYRVENGKLVETWLTLLKEGTTWPDKAPQPHWTTAAPGQM